LIAGTKNDPAWFDFGLSDAQEERAIRLHRESIVFDLVSQHAGMNIIGHYSPELQTAFRNMMADPKNGYAESVWWPYELSRTGQSDLIKEWYRQSGLTCGTYPIVVYDKDRDPLWNQVDAINARYANLPWMRYVTTAAEIRQVKHDGVVAFYAFWQPYFPPPQELKFFDVAYAKGLRSFMLTYNLMNNIGVGCTERVDAGLSRYGIDVVRHFNDIGMVVDVSHCGHLTTMDACRHSTKPVNANHTAARGVHLHARAKSDDALRAIADTGGVIGVTAIPFILSREPEPTIERMLDHIDHVAALVGWQHVAIGTDWPLQAPEKCVSPVFSPKNRLMGFRDEDGVDMSKRLVGYEDCRDRPSITRGLVKRGYDDAQIRGILGANALRVFAEVCG